MLSQRIEQSQAEIRSYQAQANSNDRQLALTRDELGGDPELREWGLRMMLVSRCLERIGDHAVDIGEQTAYLVTGEFREFTDASHGRD